MINYKYAELQKDISKLIKESNKIVNNHPYFVVIIFHELFRNLYFLP